MLLNGEMCKWFNEQPVWIREAVKLLLSKDNLDENEIESLADICEKEAINNTDEIELLKVEKLIKDENENEFSITEIGDINGVNAICADQPLKFNSNGINVVYGENGTGKSSYIRILKMISGAKNREEIKNNIYKADIVNPNCRIKIQRENGNVENISCNLKEPGEHDILRNIDIFDTRIANSYIGNENEPSYEPWIFHLIKELVELAGKIKKVLECRKSSIVVSKFNIPTELINSSFCKKISNLKYNTDEKEINIKWLEKDENKLVELEELLNSANSDLKLSELAKEGKTLNSLLAYINSFKPFYDNKNLISLSDCKENFRKLDEEKKASDILFSEKAEDVDKKSVSNSAWISLWKSAQEYYKDGLADKYVKYTEIGGTCPLCHQKITKVNVDRIKTINEYVNGNIALELISAKKKYFEKLKMLPTVKNENEIELILDNCKIEYLKDEIQIMNNTWARLGKNIAESESFSDYDDIKIFVEMIRISDIYEKIVRIREKKRAEYNDLLELQKKEKKEELKCKIIEAKGKKIVAGLKDDITLKIENLRKINIITKAIKLANTNKLTFKGKELAKILLTEKYISGFNEELKMLSKNNLRVELKEQSARKGIIPYKIVLFDINNKEVNTEDILSDGEKRAVSLAAFFAEASNREEKCPLVVDDPISSLDYEYESRVVKRLVKAAEHRQVIVFTHRISLAVGIEEEVKNKVGCNQKVLMAAGGIKGNPRDSTYFGGKVKSRISDLIGDDLSSLRKADEFSKDYNKMKASICQSFRNCVEKSVEDILINGVVKRFRRDIRTKNLLIKLVDVSKEDCEMIDRFMTEYSYYDHSSPDETPFNDFSFEKIKEDLNEFREWIEIKTKKK